jgi:hypothetical protein
VRPEADAVALALAAVVLQVPADVSHTDRHSSSTVADLTACTNDPGGTPGIDTGMPANTPVVLATVTSFDELVVETLVSATGVSTSGIVTMVRESLSMIWYSVAMKRKG